MAYKVDQTKVAAEVATFTGRVLDHWKACVAEIASDPFPRFGLDVERIIPIPPLPMRTFA